jgi:SAM-dependent methyltransferase
MIDMHSRARSAARFFDASSPTWSDKFANRGPLRHRQAVFDTAVFDILQGLSFSDTPFRILDFGCGTADISYHYSQAGCHVTGCDVSRGMLSACTYPQGDNFQLVYIGDAPDQSLPFETEKFHLILSSSVFEYLPDATLSILELSRCLTPGGAMLISVPNPAHISRGIERALAVIAKGIGHCAFLRVLPKRMARFLEYLLLSKNRFSMAEWRVILRGARLQVVRESTELMSLALLVCIKSDDGPGPAPDYPKA